MNSIIQCIKLIFDASLFPRKHICAKMLCFKKHILLRAVLERHKQIQPAPDFNSFDFFSKFFHDTMCLNRVVSLRPISNLMLTSVEQ